MALTLRTNILNKFLLCIYVLFLWATPIVSAHDEDGHNNDLKYILFERGSILSQSGQKNFRMLCEAAYLTLDFYNGHDKAKQYLDDLRKNGVKGLPKDVSEIDFSYNSHHQRFTHMGWNHDYIMDSANWETRKKVLINTVQHIGKFNKREMVKVEAFAALVYDLHILGDHCGDTETTRWDRVRLTSEPGYVGQVVSPTSEGPFYNPTLFVYLLYHTQRLFRDQSETKDYKDLESFLSNYKDKFMSADVSKESYYSDVKHFAEIALRTLHLYIPNLLKREKFFQRAFYQ